jgi:hypothetical protein
MSRFEIGFRVCLNALILVQTACAAPVLEVRNLPSASGGELVFSGQGFTAGGRVQLATRSIPGRGPRIFGVVVASELGDFQDYHYAYAFGSPYRGSGCPNRAEQDTRYLFVNAVDMSTQNTTTDNVIVPNCAW